MVIVILLIVLGVALWLGIGYWAVKLEIKKSGVTYTRIGAVIPILLGVIWLFIFIVITIQDGDKAYWWNKRIQ